LAVAARPAVPRFAHPNYLRGQEAVESKLLAGMKTRFKILLAAAAVCVIAAGAYRPARDYWKKRNQPKWQTEEVIKGRIQHVVNSTGTVKPVLSIHVGAVVSGPVKQLFKDFNEEVKADEKLALIDPQLYTAAKDRDEANLRVREAECLRAEAQLAQARNDYKRALQLYEENHDYISQAELDQLKFGQQSLEAQLAMAEAARDQAQASLNNSQTNLDYTTIKSPVDGIIIDRKIDEGQALAASFQTPELFIVAPDLRKKMHIYATVDESEIGNVRKAQKEGQAVHFTVSAHPDDLFTGKIEEIRLSSTEVQSVVMYPVIVAAPNPDMKLLPGMTAEISFSIEERKDVLKIPNAALRFYPEEKFVRPEDQKLLKGEQWATEEKDEPDAVLSAEEKAEARRKRNRRTVWVVDGDFLRAIEVELGLSDSKYSELVQGKIKLGDKLVTGIEPKK